MISSPAMLVRFRPAGPWRFGPDDGARDRVDSIGHSDTVYAALCAAFASLGQLDAWLEATAKAATPAVRVSSLFPFQGRTLLAPPPRSLWPPHGAYRLRFQAAQFAPMNLIQELIAEQPGREDRYEIDPLSACVIPAGGHSPFRAVQRTAAAVDRLDGAAAPHETACLEFNQGSGLWFVAVFADHDARTQWSAPLETAVRLLGDTGIGGERSRGWGRSESVDVDKAPLGRLLFGPQFKTQDSETNAYWLLSLYAPAANEPIDWTLGDYRLRTRAGRIESPAAWGAEKRRQRVLTEGSVVVSAATPQGTMHDAAPAGFAHPVYRNACAVAIPIPWKSAADRPLVPFLEPQPKPEPEAVATPAESTEAAPAVEATNAQPSDTNDLAATNETTSGEPSDAASPDSATETDPIASTTTNETTDSTGSDPAPPEPREPKENPEGEGQ